MPLRQHLGNLAVGLLPATRAYRLKTRILRWMGVDVAPTARIVSSARVWGTLRLKIGDDSFLGHDVLITGGDATVSIGAGVALAPRVTIVAGTHEIDMVGRSSAGRPLSRDVRIEDGAWIGAGTTILGGVAIGRKAVVAAGSTVTEDVPPYVVAAGAPCRPRKYWNDRDLRWRVEEAQCA